MKRQEMKREALKKEKGWRVEGGRGGATLIANVWRSADKGEDEKRRDHEGGMFKVTQQRRGLAHLVVHLLRAVEHVHHDAQGSAQVFGGLRLPCACGTCRSAAHGEVEGLRQRDVASP